MEIAEMVKRADKISKTAEIIYGKEIDLEIKEIFKAAYIGVHCGDKFIYNPPAKEASPVPEILVCNQKAIKIRAIIEKITPINEKVNTLQINSENDGIFNVPDYAVRDNADGTLDIIEHVFNAAIFS